jgi:hypothetical protein
MSIMSRPTGESMKLKVEIQAFTYLEVLEALNAYYKLDMEGVKICTLAGYAVQGCKKNNMPDSATQETP